MQTVSHGNKGAIFVLSVYRIQETHVAGCWVLDRQHCVPISYGHASMPVCEWILCAPGCCALCPRRMWLVCRYVPE